MGTEENMDVEVKAEDTKTEKGIKTEQEKKSESKSDDDVEVKTEDVKPEVNAEDMKTDVNAGDIKTDSDMQVESKDGVKEESEVKEDGDISPLEKKIIRQIEYYFGNYNLFADKFLREQIKLNEGWVEMETMMKFNRLKQLSSDTAAVIVALKKSPNDLMEVNEDGTKIRRTLLHPIPLTIEDQKKEIDSRTVYVKGFLPQTSLDELLDYFQPYGNPENILMRRRANKKFKGSVFATFLTKEEAHTFLKLKDVKYKGTELIREMKLDYVKRKDEWFKQMIKEREEKKKLKQEAKTEEDGSEKSEDGKFKNLVKGCLLKLSGLAEGTMWEDIKDVLSPHGSIAFVDYSKGKPLAYVRFEEGIAAKVLEAVGAEVNDAKTVKIKEADALAVVLDGDEEVEYWKNVSKMRSQRSGGRGRRGGRQGGGGRGGFHGKRKHGNFKQEGGGGPRKKSRANGAGE